MTRARTAAPLIFLCAVVWADQFPIAAPDQSWQQEVRVEACDGGGSVPSTVSVSTRVVDQSGAPMGSGTWETVGHWSTPPPSSPSGSSD